MPKCAQWPATFSHPFTLTRETHMYILIPIKYMARFQASYADDLLSMLLLYNLESYSDPERQVSHDVLRCILSIVFVRTGLLQKGILIGNLPAAPWLLVFFWVQRGARFVQYPTSKSIVAAPRPYFTRGRNLLRSTPFDFRMQLYILCEIVVYRIQSSSKIVSVLWHNRWPGVETFKWRSLFQSCQDCWYLYLGNTTGIKNKILGCKGPVYRV